MAAGNNRTVITALVANAGIAVAKFIGFAITGSSSMLSEAVHSVADTSNQLLLLLGARQAKRKASYDHPFGYGRERYFWSFVVSMILFSLGGLFAIYEGKHKIDHPTEIESPGVALVILVIGFGLEGYAFMTAKAEAERLRGRNSWPSFIRRSKNPEVPVVLLEDAGALIGLTIAFLGIILAVFVDPIFDGIATVLIGLLLLSIAIVLAVEMKSLLIGESASPENRDRLVGAVEGHRDVVKLIDMRTQHLGPDEILVGAKVHYRENLTTPELANAINETELSMRTAVEERLTIYLEPDLFDPEVYVDELAPDAADPFENYTPANREPEPSNGFVTTDREGHDDRKTEDGRETRRDQPESFASVFGTEHDAITTPTADGESVIDLEMVDEASRRRAADNAEPADLPAVPLPTPESDPTARGDSDLAAPADNDSTGNDSHGSESAGNDSAGSEDDHAHGEPDRMTPDDGGNDDGDASESDDSEPDESSSNRRSRRSKRANKKRSKGSASEHDHDTTNDNKDND